MKIKNITHHIVSEPGKHSIRIEKRSISENLRTFELKNETNDPNLNLSVVIIPERIRCGEKLELKIKAGNSSEDRLVAILDRDKVEDVKNERNEIIRSSRWLAEIGSVEKDLSFDIETSGWPIGFYGVIVFSESHKNNDITFLILGNVSIDYNFSKQNFTDVVLIRKNVEEILIYEEEWSS